MIELDATPNAMSPELVGNARVVRGLNGAGQMQVRLGGHFRMALTFPPMWDADEGRKMKSKLVAGARQIVKIELPLSGSQGLPGAPVVDGAGQTGHTLAVRGLTPHYAGRVGWWLNIIAADGTICLHDVAEPFVADAAGEAIIPISPALRLPFADGDAVELARPAIAGYIEPRSWNVTVDFLNEFEVVLEEAI